MTTPYCPHCGAVLEIVLLAPGDKAGRCKYCETVVDLPDGNRVVTEEERVGPDGTRVRRRVEVSQSASGRMPDLMGHVNEMLAQVQEQARQGGVQGGVQGGGQGSVHEVRHEHVEMSSHTSVQGDWEDMPPEVQGMLAGMGIDLSAAKPRPEPEPEPVPVLVQWPDGARYPGKLVETREQQALVEFSDGSRRWVPEASVIRRG